MEHFHHEVLRRLDQILRLLEKPKLTIQQFGGNIMAVGNITAGTSGNFGAVVTFPTGVTAPSGYEPSITWSSPDPLITFTPQTTDASGGTLPLSQQIVVNVGVTDTNTSGTIGASTTAPDGTVINAVSSFTITPAPPPAEPTLSITQFS